MKMAKIRIHKRELSDRTTAYYFTKSKKRCLRIEHNTEWDFGKTPSGCTINQVEIHYQNSFLTDELSEIELNDVPEVIRDILSYL